MKKFIFGLLFSLLCFYAFSDIPFCIDRNTFISVRTEEKSLDVYIDFIKNTKIIDTYVIEALGPDRMIQSICHHNINGRDYLFIEFYFGNPGGFQMVNKRNLFVLELDSGKIFQKYNIELTNIIYSSRTKEYTDTQNYWFFFEQSSNSIVLYEEQEYVLTEVKRIKLDGKE